MTDIYPWAPPAPIGPQVTARGATEWQQLAWTMLADDAGVDLTTVTEDACWQDDAERRFGHAAAAQIRVYDALMTIRFGPETTPTVAPAAALDQAPPADVPAARVDMVTGRYRPAATSFGGRPFDDQDQHRHRSGIRLRHSGATAPLGAKHGVVRLRRAFLNGVDPKPSLVNRDVPAVAEDPNVRDLDVVSRGLCHADREADGFTDQAQVFQVAVRWHVDGFGGSVGGAGSAEVVQDIGRRGRGQPSRVPAGPLEPGKGALASRHGHHRSFRFHGGGTSGIGLERGSGTIITVSSGIGFLPFPVMPTYGASKAAVHAYTEALRAQLAGTGVEVAELVPPAVATRVGGSNPHALDPTPHEILVQAVRMHRWAERDGTYEELVAQRSQALAMLPGRSSQS